MGGGLMQRELSPEEEGQHAELVQAAKTKELDAWKKSDVFEPRKDCDVQRKVVQTRWVPA